MNTAFTSLREMVPPHCHACVILFSPTVGDAKPTSWKAQEDVRTPSALAAHENTIVQPSLSWRRARLSIPQELFQPSPYS